MFLSLQKLYRLSKFVALSLSRKAGRRFVRLDFFVQCWRKSSSAGDQAKKTGPGVWGGKSPIKKVNYPAKAGLTSFGFWLQKIISPLRDRLPE